MGAVLVRLFERDSELLRNVARREAEKVRQAAIVRLITLESGEWRPPLLRLRTGDLGLLILDGLIARRTRVIGRTAVELVGPGDILRPWNGEEDTIIPATLSVEVSPGTTVALLDAGFAATIARWPEILPQILERMATRTSSLGFQLAIARLPSLELRLLCQLWHLADRWGHVGRHGIALRLPLSQELLADLTSSTRPSVSAALGRLRTRGLVERTGFRQYRLHGRSTNRARRPTTPQSQPHIVTRIGLDRRADDPAQTAPARSRRVPFPSALR